MQWGQLPGNISRFWFLQVTVFPVVCVDKGLLQNVLSLRHFLSLCGNITCWKVHSLHVLSFLHQKHCNLSFPSLVARVCVCICTLACVWLCVCPRACVLARTRARTCVCVCVCARAHVCLRAHARTRVCLCWCAFVHSTARSCVCVVFIIPT